MGVKEAGAYGRTYRLRVMIFLKSGSFNILEPSRPVPACTGIALPLHLRSAICRSTQFVTYTNSKQLSMICLLQSALLTVNCAGEYI